MENLSASTARLPISVIIAMYNTEKYIGECLESLLSQTFKEFEVIVMDDCSGDNSNAVAKSYEKKFNGLLKLVRLKKNSGNNGIPNNMGLALSRGEYVLFMDSDDTITSDALEKLYTAAKDFDADVVSCEKFYNVPQESWNNPIFMKELKPYSYKKGEFVTEPTLITEDIAERVKKCAQRHFIWNIWSKLIRRDFLVNNEISITNEMANDMMLTLFLIYSVKRFVVVPYTINYYRVLSTSLTHQKRDPLKQLKKYLRALTVGIRHLNNYLSQREFFQENAECKYTALNIYAQEIYDGYIQKVYDKVPARDREEALIQEFAVADNTALTAFLFESLANFSSRRKDELLKLSPYITARLDIKLITKTEQGDFKIVSVSDDKATVWKPAWFNKGGIGYQIQSYAGSLEIVAKATSDGQIYLSLKGLDIRDPKDNSTRIPYWVDYTKLTLNGKTVFDKVTPTWHDKPYRYNLNVKAGDEIKIQTEWLPHRGELSAAATTQENISPIADKSLKKSVARIDFKLETTDGGDFQILSVSDDKADVTKAAWLTGNNIGYFIQSDAGKLEIVTKVVKGGRLVLGLRGRDVRDPEDKSKRIPDWIDYTKFTVNGKVIFDKVTPTWHDKPYSYMTEIENDSEVIMQVEWNYSAPVLVPNVASIISNAFPISVIIPMYNAEEYIGECLDSLLIQTFQNFEVIIADDCSEDNSVAIVKSYEPKFNGRLRLEKTEKNSGGGGYIPRNLGLTLARGKYVYFMDADDFILNTALETLYTAAEEFNTDVVYSSAHYDVRKPNDVFVFRDGLGRELLENSIADKSTLIADNPNKILYDHSFKVGFTFPWVKFIRRDFLIKNRIFFPEITKAGDHIWTINLYCHAKRILRLPIPLYFYRNYTSSSVSRTTRNLPEQISYWVSAFLEWLEALGELINKTKILKKNLACCYEISRLDFKFLFTRLTSELSATSTQKVYEILYNELSKRNDVSHLNVIPFFFSAVDARQKEIKEMQETYSHATFNKFSARLDIQLITKVRTGDFKIVSVSDDKADVRKPAWLQKSGVGYQIHSYEGNLDLVTKATADGQLRLELKGLDVRDPHDDSKRLPCWIDYTCLIINGKKIFNRITPAWHDKPFRYNMNVKAGDEIKLQTEWQPHRETATLATAQATPEAIADKFLPYLTARLDVKLASTEGGDFQIISTSDNNANVLKAAWLTDNNIGYFVQSHVGKLELVAKIVGGGRFHLGLRGINVPDPKDNAKHIPYWIDYTKLIVNGNTVFDSLTPVWYEKAYNYALDVKDGEEITVQAEWLPHTGDSPAASKSITSIQETDAKIIERFKRWFSARLDLRMLTTNKNDFQIVSISDDKAEVRKPGWFNKNGVGYVIQSYAGKLDIVFKVIEGGLINMNLKSLFYADSKNKSKHIPYWIDYIKFTVNDKVIFNKLTPVWHDAPYNYKFEAKGGEKVRISVEWLPHRSDT